MTGEFDLIAILRERTAVARDDVRLGIGDDAALVVPKPGQDLAVATDALVAGVHFPEATRAEDLGWKSLAVNLSDLAAMGAEPAFALLSLSLPAPDRSFVEGFADGFAALAAAHRVALIGGDTTRGPLNVCVTVLGFVPSGRALRRAGARAGDLVFATGTLGDAAAALRLLGERDDAHSSNVDGALFARLHRPTPRVAAGIALRDVASSCIDVSDGLLADLGHVAASSGVGIEIDASSLPMSAELERRLDADARIACAAAGGDDYELAFTLPPENEPAMMQSLANAGCRVTRIGRIVEGSGVRLLDDAGDEIRLRSAGWDHFA